MTGDGSSKLGENEIEVNVLGSDNGAFGTYTITVIKRQGTTPETAPIGDNTHVTIGTTSYTITDNFDQALLPVSYESESFICGNRTV